MQAYSSSSSSTSLSLSERVERLRQNFKGWQNRSPDYRFEHPEESPLFQIMHEMMYKTDLLNFISASKNNLLNEIVDEEAKLALSSDKEMNQLLLLALVLLEVGEACFNRYPDLIAKISEKLLNQTIISEGLTERSSLFWLTRNSPLFWLTSTARGQAFLSKHSKLIAKITPEGLNQAITGEENAGQSPLFCLTMTSEGRDLLVKYPELIAKITQEGLNQVVARGEYAGKSPLFWLVGTPKGRELFRKHSELMAKITQEGLNQVTTSGKFSGSSPLYYLISTPEGWDLFNRYSNLIIPKITEAGLNQVVTSGPDAGASPFFWLAANEAGQELLDEHPELIAKITQKGLNQAITGGELPGASLLFVLTRTPKGLAFLGRHPELITKITQKGLNQAITSGEYAGQSPLYWLTYIPERRKLLSEHPELIAKITREGLNQIVIHGKHAEYSPLFWLTGTPEGLVLLDQHRGLIAKITQEGLNYVITSGEHAGQSPLFYLIGISEGRKLLGEHLELVAKITREGLSQVVTSGKYAGQSPLVYLTADDEKRAFLSWLLPKIEAELSAEDQQKVFETFQKNASEDFSLYGLAYCYEKGIGCAVDKDQALELYLSADVGVLEAKLACARLYEDKEQFDKVRAIYQVLIESRGFSNSSLALQVPVLSQSLKLDPDPHLEARLYQVFKAAVPVPEAWLGLGQCYLFGIGTGFSANKAKSCFEKAREYEGVRSEAEGYLTVLNQGSDFKKHYCNELAQQLSVLGIKRVGASDDGLYRFRLSVEFIRKLGATEGLSCQVSLSKAALLKLSGILLPSENLLSYPSIIAAFKGAYHAEQRRLKIEAVMTVKNRRLEIAERFGKIYNELRKLLNNHAPQVYRAWNSANQINRDLSSGAGKESVSRKSAGFFTSFTSLKDKLLQNERALEQSRNQYLDDYLAFHQRYIKGNELGKAVSAYQADDFENGDLLLDKAKGQALLAEMERVLGNIQTLVSELKVSLDGFQTKHKDFEKFAGHYRFQGPVDSRGNLSEAVSVPSYLEYIQAAELEYARFEAIQKALPPAIEEKKEEVDSEEEIFESFNTLSLVNQSEPILLSDEQLRPLVQGQPVMTAASSAVSSSGLYYFSHQNYAPKAFEKRLDFSELSHCLTTLQDAKEDEAKVLIYALLYELGDVMERLKNLNAHEFCRSHASQLRNVLYHATQLEPIKQPHLYLHDYRELSQKLVAYLARVPVSFTKVFDVEKLMTEIPCGLFNILLNYPSEEPLKSEEIIELITGLNGQESLIQNSQLTEEYQVKAGKFIIGRKGALLADLEHQFPNAYQLYFAGNVSVKTDRELGKEFRHGLEY